MVALFTDSPEFAARMMPEHPARQWGPAVVRGDVDRWVRAFLGPPRHMVRPTDRHPWPHILLARTAERSNYDRLIELVRGGESLPDGLVCLAGAGQGFHGFKGRHWAAVPGNLHLSVHLAPRRPIERFEVAFMALAAVSVVDAIDRVPGLTGMAGIRWVNDVVLEDAKVAGVLAYTHAQRTTVNSAVLGIGVNVGTRPSIEPTPFVPEVTHLAERAQGADVLPRAFRELLDALARNYRVLLDRGCAPLVERYRDRSVVVGRTVAVCAEDSDTEPEVRRSGVVRSVGDGLELYLEGQDTPVTRGRIIMGEAMAAASAERSIA